MSYYAVAKGRKVGVYQNWNDCKLQIHKFSGPKFKKFSTLDAAEEFIRQNSGDSVPPQPRPQPPKKTKRSASSRGDDEAEEENRGAKKPKKVDENGFSVDPEGYVEVYTDGACTSNGKGVGKAKAGVGVWFSAGSKYNISKPVENGRATNNYAEINAVTQAAQQAQKAGIKKLRIYTDSQFVISCVNDWMPGWKRKNWLTSGGKPVINKNELIEMEKALAPLDVVWNHVRGHIGVHGNEMADQLARAGAELYQN